MFDDDYDVDYVEVWWWLWCWLCWCLIMIMMLILMMMNYYWRRILTCNWRRLWWCMHVLKIVDDLLMNICINWVICSCIHDVGVGLYIHIGDDQILYPNWRRWILCIHIGNDRMLCIHIGDDYDTYVSWGDDLSIDLVPLAYRSRV
jgi:hypothetical protein